MQRNNRALSPEQKSGNVEEVFQRILLIQQPSGTLRLLRIAKMRFSRQPFTFRISLKITGGNSHPGITTNSLHLSGACRGRKIELACIRIRRKPHRSTYRLTIFAIALHVDVLFVGQLLPGSSDMSHSQFLGSTATASISSGIMSTRRRTRSNRRLD